MGIHCSFERFDLRNSSGSNRENYKTHTRGRVSALYAIASLSTSGAVNLTLFRGRERESPYPNRARFRVSRTTFSAETLVSAHLDVSSRGAADAGSVVGRAAAHAVHRSELHQGGV